MKIINFLIKIQYFGVKDVNDTRDREKIILINRIALTMFATGFPYIFIFKYFSLKIASLLVIPACIIYCLIFAISRILQM